MSKLYPVLSSTNKLEDNRLSSKAPSLHSHDNFKSITLFYSSGDYQVITVPVSDEKALFLYSGTLVSLTELTAIFAFSQALKG